MKKLGVIDKGFLLAESREMPMHVGGLNLYTLPEGADEGAFLHDLASNLRDTDSLLPPFGDRLKTGRLGTGGPAYWEPDPALDLDYHIRHSALPKPGRYRELFTLVSRLHGTLLDRSRPLWEMHLIEGLQDRQFAVYTKTHHAAVDGARSMHISRSMLSTDPDHVLEESPLSLQSWQKYKAGLKPGRPQEYSKAELRNVSDFIKSSLDSGISVFRSVRGIARALTGRGGPGLPHLHVPSTALNTDIDGARRFVAQSWPFSRIKAVARAFDGTFNDAVLAMCSGALRRYLQTHAELPDESLKAMVPVSLRAEGDVEAGNAVAVITADLATATGDPAERFRKIRASVNAGKDYFRAMSKAEIELFTLIMQVPALMLMPLGMISRLPPYNVTISNVPGIRETMYWNGARMDGNYPVSIVVHGMTMNITLVTYNESVDFGIIASRRALPQVQRMIDYMEESLRELEDAAGLKTLSGKKSSARKQSPARRKSKSKSKSKSVAAASKPGGKRKARAKTTAKAQAASGRKAAAKPKSAAKPKTRTKPKTRARRN